MLVLVLALALPQNPITLPPVQRPPAQPDRPVARATDFTTDAQALRRSQMRTPAREDEALAALQQRYPDLATRAVAAVRTADPDLAYGLLRAIERFGGAADADTVEAILLTRALGVSTAQAVQTLIQLRQTDAKEALFRCLASRIAGARREVAVALKPRLGAEDAARVIEVGRSGGADGRAAAVLLLGATPTPAARAHLIGALSASDAVLAAAACESLVEHGAQEVSDLREILGRAAIDRGFGYAAVTLARLELKGGGDLLTESMVPFLHQELDSHDMFMRVASSIALAQLAYRSEDTEGQRYADRAVVEGLMLVVAPSQFVPGFGILQPVARDILRRFSGRDLSTPDDWQGWWKVASGDYVGMRRVVSVTEQTGTLATLTLRLPQRTVRVRGEATAPPAALEEGAEDYVLSGEEMVELVRRLRDAGFMRSPAGSAVATGVPLVRSLQLRVGNAGTRFDAPEREPWMDRYVAELDGVAARERWQLYPGADATDFKTFWRGERAWLAGNAERAARDAHLKNLILGALPRLQGPVRARAIEHLNDVPELSTLLTEDDGLRIVAAVAAGEALDPGSERLLALASRIDSDRVWREALTTVDRFFDKGGKDALARLFALLGVERVLDVLLDPRRNLRLAAMAEVADMKELRAVPALLTGLRDADEDVRQTATYVLGMLRADEARDPIVNELPSLSAPARRVAWVALGRIGGEGVLAILMQATTLENADDKRAAIQALGKLDEPGAPEYLANLFVAAGYSPIGNFALLALQDQGALRARTALRRAMESAREPRVRAEIVQVLAEFQDPSVVPALLDLLDDPRQAGRTALQLAAITGLDVVNLPDRKTAMRQWWQRNQGRSQAAWFLTAAAEAGMTTTLGVHQLQPGAGVEAVPELTRLLTAADRPHLRQLALTLLRDTTQREFGALPPQARPEELLALADRYRFYAEAVGAVRKQ